MPRMVMSQERVAELEREVARLGQLLKDACDREVSYREEIYSDPEHSAIIQRREREAQAKRTAEYNSRLTEDDLNESLAATGSVVIGGVEYREAERSEYPPVWNR
jgi:hypothetical protein